MYLWLQSADLAVERVRERVRAGGHDVAEEVIRRRYATGLKNFWRIYQPLADTWAVYDNSDWRSPIIIAQGISDTSEAVVHVEPWRRFRGMNED